MNQEDGLKASVIAMSFVMLSSVPISTVYADIMLEFGESPRWLLNMMTVSPNLMNMLATAASGIFLRWTSVKRLFLSAILLLLASGILPIFGGGLATILLSRSIVGICCGALAPLVTVLAAGSFPPQEANRVMGQRAAAQALGSMVMMIVAMILAVGGWRRAFNIYFIAVPVFVVVLCKIPAVPIAVVENGAAQQEIIENRLKSADIPFVTLYTMFAFVYMLCLNTLAPSLSSFLVEEGVGHGIMSGIGMGLYMLGSFVCGVYYDRFSSRLQIYTLPSGLAATTAGIGLIALAHSLPAVYLGCVLQGAGFAIFNTAGVLNASDRFQGAEKRRVIHLFLLFAGMGSFLSPFLMDAISRIIYGAVSMRGRFSSAAAGMAGLTICMLLCSGTLLGLPISKKER